jgi:hypothetical protein
MALNSGDVITRAQALLDDNDGREFDADYLMPYYNIALEDVWLELANVNARVEERLVTLAVPLGTTDYSTFEATGQGLETMLQPVTLDWKLVGEADTAYRPARRVQQLPDVSGETGIVAWEFREGHIFTTPSDVALTVRVRFQRLASVINDAADAAQRGLVNILAYRTAALQAVDRLVQYGDLRVGGAATQL